MAAKESIDKLVAEKIDELMQQQRPPKSVQLSENSQVVQVFDLDAECRQETNLCMTAETA